MTAILVLYGLPKLLTGSILAHEVMHAWLRMHGCTHLGPKEEEGLCQLVALLWLERQDPAYLKVCSLHMSPLKPPPLPSPQGNVYGHQYRLACGEVDHMLCHLYPWMGAITGLLARRMLTRKGWACSWQQRQVAGCNRPAPL